MPSKNLVTVTYVTSSSHKVDEIKVFETECSLEDGSRVGDLFHFETRNVSIPERLEVNLEKMVEAEVVEAYSRTKIPCVVEHAGLVFDDYKDKSYPGGLTKAMWNALGEEFIAETRSAGRHVVARAVVGYCDGMKVRTFVGETAGVLAEHPRGDRKFYWDTVLIPNGTSGPVSGKTYSEIVQDPNLGLSYKMAYLSQSARAFRKLLAYLRQAEPTGLWG